MSETTNHQSHHSDLETRRISQEVRLFVGQTTCQNETTCTTHCIHSKEVFTMAYVAKMFVGNELAVQHQYDNLELAKSWVDLMKYSYEVEGANVSRLVFTIDTI